MLIGQLIILCFYTFLSSSLFVAAQSKCNHQAELSALIQFKDGFEIDCTLRSYSNPIPYPKTSSWSLENLNNASSSEWDGVECDQITGHVIGLDLNSSCLYGSIKSNITTIFSLLVHLKYLNLAFNNFIGSSIPSELGNLSRLTYLNLSSSVFAGRVPLEISKLYMLSSLDLSGNLVSELNLKSLIQNLTNLEQLDLSGTILSSEVPVLFTNMSSLRSLKLDGCGLYGEFPQGIFHLPKLQHLSIKWNQELKGYLPDFNWSTRAPLESLVLGVTGFSGTIPISFGNLVSLRKLDLSFCKLLWEPVPDSVGNLVSLTELDLSGCKLRAIPASLGNLTHLNVLDLSHCNVSAGDFNSQSLSWVGKLTNLIDLSLFGANLNGEIPSSFANLINLSSLDLSGNRLTGHIPSTLTNLTQLSQLRLKDNHLIGEIPPGVMNLTQLTVLDLRNNALQGPLPVWNLRNLEYLDVSNNNLSGSLELDIFFQFKSLTFLLLSSNNLTLLESNSSTSSEHPKLGIVGLSSCWLSKFPKFLQNQQELNFIDLSNNNLEGSIPKWMANVSVDSLGYLNLSHNLITGFEDPIVFLPWPYIDILDISFNKFQGLAPVPSPFVLTYIASGNEFTGEIPQSICNARLLGILDFSSNHLTGELQHCFGEFNTYLQILNLRNNSFHGSIPELCTSGNRYLTMIDLNNNQLHGKIPRSLANCSGLEFFDIGSNLINDHFPSWLGSLTLLKVVILRDNALYGSMGVMERIIRGHWFSELRILDLSRNNLSGNLASGHFEQWTTMQTTTSLSNPSYLGQTLSPYYVSGFYTYSFTIYSKGVEREYMKILDALIAIDLSSNGFEGEIPTIIGDLEGLRLLNLSNNRLSGGIPSSLGNLEKLESLDLSSNKISEQIPQQLTRLNFLSVFDVSRNNLSGPIPQGRQFDTFQNNSYIGNSGLCGKPLSRECGSSGKEPPPEMTAEKHDKFWDDINGEILWLVVSIGFGGGLVVGIVIENMVDLRNPILSLFWGRNRRRRQPLRRN